VIADHIRATAFLVSDGVIPSNEGRGYVQRRIIRRAIRHGYKLGKKTPFFHKLVPTWWRLMGEAYPRLAEQRAHHRGAAGRGRALLRDAGNGMEILDAALAGGAKVLPGEVAFKLHDTYGFPLDLSADVCRERGRDGGRSRLPRRHGQAEGRRPRGRQVQDGQGAGIHRRRQRLRRLRAAHADATKVVALYADGAPVQALKAGQTASWCWTARRSTPRAAARWATRAPSSPDAAMFEVGDTQKIKADVFGHHGTLKTRAR
jgi:alanyl-tRNA synthetase